jgi:hypothetical protein
MLEAIVHKALARPLGERYASAAELAQDLDQVVEEAGGRFSSIGAIGRYLQELGIHLQAAPASLLTKFRRRCTVASRRNAAPTLSMKKRLPRRRLRFRAGRPSIRLDAGERQSLPPSTAKAKSQSSLPPLPPRSVRAPLWPRPSDGVAQWTA